MTTRRTFLSVAPRTPPLRRSNRCSLRGQSDSGSATKGSVGTGASGRQSLPTSDPSTSGHYRPPYRFGLGGVAIGNGFKPTTDAQAQETLEAAWAAGVRYYDTSPWYRGSLGIAASHPINP